MFSSINGLERI